MKQIEQLQAKVQQLETTQQTQAISTKDVDATVDRVLKDAEQKSKLLQMEGFTAGYNRGRFTIQDAQGNWVLRPRFEFQFRAIANWRDDAKQGGDTEDKEKGFQIGRMAFGADGVACNPNLTYMFMWNTTTDGGLVLEQAWAKYFVNDDWAVRLGQMRNPVFHEQAVGPTNQLAVDVSQTNILLTGTAIAYTQAITMMYDRKDSPIQAEIGFEDGFNSQNTDFTDPDSGGSSNWGIFARVNYLVSGNYADYNSFSAMGNRDNLLVVGGGGDWTQNGDSDAFLHTVDVQWENAGGLGIYAAYIGNWIDSGVTDDSFYNWGLIFQAGYMVNEQWEVFGRVGFAAFDEALLSVGEDEQLCELTFGTTYYMCGNNAKITLDVTYLSGGAPDDAIDQGVLANGNNEFVFRGQFQLLL
jgi:hypothetical protein